MTETLQHTPGAGIGTRLRRVWSSPALGVTSRVIAAIVGGFALANLGAILLAALLPMARGEAVATGVLSSFAIYTAAVIWVFAARSAARAWLGLLGTAGACALIAWLLIGVLQ
ncbi:DUF3649 domain-containing protein [Aquisalimonas asiatica]|uniref:Iron transporter n=1 Tax=Aquisalimonas asiatica TaxID=406100 RepID=A0A1H8SZB5_9GAMM|nr:DUF3649 domain-containing protein [Aquisalimonas asiatica]SEO83694.1 Protein of unknown function [Aquisalimonas asiatica]